MHTEPIAEIERLLVNTLAAHSVYETTVLGGVYDEDWAGWYAAYLRDHGLPAVLPRAASLDASQLRAILAQLHRDYTEESPDADWQPWYAERLGAMVEQAQPAR
jgi:hypothetical protein